MEVLAGKQDLEALKCEVLMLYVAYIVIFSISFYMHIQLLSVMVNQGMEGRCFDCSTARGRGHK